MSKHKSISEFFKRSAASTSISSNENADRTTGDVPEITQTSSFTLTSPVNMKEKNPTVRVIDKPFHPEKNYRFPKTKFGRRERCCQSQWFENYNWLHYEEKDDSVICFVCAEQELKGNLRSEKSKDQAYISRGFSSWKKAPKCFEEHQSSSCHKTALSCHAIVPQYKDVLELTYDHVTKSRLEERQYFIKVMECVQYLGRQGIAFQGDKSEKNDNFNQLMLLRAKDDLRIIKRLHSTRGENKKYTHTDFQNELLMIMANQVVEKISKSVRENGYYAIMCHEYTDISNKEQLSFCVRWADSDLNLREDFLGFYEIDNIESNTIVAAIKDMLIRIQLSLSNCSGQTYDGASNMLGRKSGVATQISTIQPKAPVTHCHGHSLSLAVKDLTSRCKILHDTMGTVGEICVLVKFSPKRENMLSKIHESVEGEFLERELREKGTTLDKLCVTRWTVRSSCFLKIRNSYDELFTLWEECLSQKLTPDIKARIHGCDSQMKRFSFYFGLWLCHRLYSLTDNLSAALQKEKMSSISSQRLVSLTVKTIEGLRNDENFNLFFETVAQQAKKHPLIQEPTLPRKRSRPDYSILQHMEGYTKGMECHHPRTAEDHYRQIYFEAIDVIIASIKDRFDQPGYKTFAALESLLLNAIDRKPFDDELEHVKTVYGDDIASESLLVEVDIFKQLFLHESVDCFDDIVNKLKIMDKESFLIPNITEICKRLLVNPATSATPERSFSLARRVKTWLRSTMTQKRFNAVAMLSYHKDLTDALDLVQVGNEFVSLHHERYKVFGTFLESDLEKE